MNDTELTNHLVKLMPEHFRCFGGGQGGDWNPIAEALKHRSTQFAAGVDVKDVVTFILAEAKCLRQKAVAHNN